MRTETAPTIHLDDYAPPAWLVERVMLDIALDPRATRVRARLGLRPNPAVAEPGPVDLDGDGLVLTALALNGAALSPQDYTVSPERLRLLAPPRAAFILDVETQIDPSANTQLMGLYRSGRTYCTQCEAEGFRRITYFPDRPDVMAVFTTRIEAAVDDAPVLLANGNLVGRGAAGPDRHFALWHDPFPKPSYLFAVVGGALACIEDRFVTVSGRVVALKIFVEPGKESRCDYALDCLKRAMRWDEEAFGREYDLDVFMIVAVSDFNMGAMENKGLNIFNDKYVLATPDTATDADFANIEAIIAHEYFHNWTGNRITCRDWFQLCLKEGLTVFRDQEFSGDQRSRTVKRIADVRMLRAHQFTEDAGPLAHPVRPTQYREINNFYTATVYEKGAEIVRMLKTMLGPDAFRRGMDLYFDRHDGRAATVEDFIGCFAQACGRDLSRFMLWYAQSGTPELVVSGGHDAVGKVYRLDIAQVVPPTPGQPVKEPMDIPLVVALIDPEGRECPLNDATRGPIEGGVVMLERAAESFVFTGIGARPVPSVNRGFSAPVRISGNLTPADEAFLAARDTDPFNRWQALQSIETRHLIADVAARRAGTRAENPAPVIAAIERLLGEPDLEPAFVAQALALPSEADIARDIGHDVDPEAIFIAREALRAAIGRTLGDALRAIAAAPREGGPYRPDARGAGARARRNACLDLLASTGAPDAIALARAHFDRADNMTDRLAALTMLAVHDAPGRAAWLDCFYTRYQSDPLVVDKWFALQAMLPDAATLERVQALAVHPAFSFTTPNRVRALFGSFAQANPVQFNRRDGLGYGIVTDAVLRLDPLNPQVAARLLSSFRNWRALEPVRRAAAERALHEVAATPTLSRDVADIVERALANDDAR